MRSLCLTAALLAGVLGGCAHRIPLAEQYKVADVHALVQRMHSSDVRAHAYSAEARLRFFGEAGRFRGTASLLVARPDRLRYELQGPHGGVLLAIACDGNTLSTVDLRNGKYQHVPATPENLDSLLQWVPLGLPAGGWVGLLFGEVAVPDRAELSYDDHHGAYVLAWDDPPGASPSTPVRQVQVFVAPDTGRVLGAVVQLEGTVVSDVRIEEHTPDGLPSVLRLKAPMQNADLEVRLRDVAVDPPFDPAAFLLSPP